MSSRPKVVIVGGGYGGIAVAKQLDPDFDVVLLEKKDKFFHNIAALRGVVQEGFENNLFIPYDNLLKRGKFVQAEVSEIETDGVLTTAGDKFNFDFLVIALGTSYAEPFKVTSSSGDTKDTYRGVHERLKSSEKVLIVGAGPVGVELAGEIATEFPRKEVTLVGSELLKGATNQKFKEKAQYKLEKELRVKLILGERLQLDNAQEGDQKTPRTFTTDKGTVIEADTLFVCTGNTINNAPLMKHFSNLLEDGRLKVNQFLQVEGHDNIFAVGDITNLKELKLGYLAGFHAKVAAANIKTLAAKKTKLKAYVPGKQAMFVSLGRKNGAGAFGSSVFGGTIVGALKSKNLFVAKSWASLNQKLPKE